MTRRVPLSPRLTGWRRNWSQKLMVLGRTDVDADLYR
jgi:hypothetical protein